MLISLWEVAIIQRRVINKEVPYGDFKLEVWILTPQPEKPLKPKFNIL